MSKYDDEIQEVERRLVRERKALRLQAENLSSTARQAAGSAKGLVAALVVGFLFGEVTAPRRRKRGRREERDQTIPAPAKTLGVFGVLGSAALTFIRHRYGSPWVLANRAWHAYQVYQAQRRPGGAYAGRGRPAMSRSAAAAPGAAGRGAAHSASPSTIHPGPTAGSRDEPIGASRERDAIRKTHATS